MQATTDKPAKRHELTAAQAQLLADIEQRRRVAVTEWDVALRLAGFDPTKIVGGNLADDPHFMVKD